MTFSKQHLTGHCYCGATRYAVSGEPLSVHACHCTDCQAQSGSAFALSMVLHAEQLRVTAGAVDTRTFMMGERETHHHVCAMCGGTLWLSATHYPGIIALKPGTLDDTRTLKPVAHLWVRSAQPWVTFPPDAVVFDEQPTFAELMALNVPQNPA